MLAAVTITRLEKAATDNGFDLDIAEGPWTAPRSRALRAVAPVQNLPHECGEPEPNGTSRFRLTPRYRANSFSRVTGRAIPESEALRVRCFSYLLY